MRHTTYGGTVLAQVDGKGWDGKKLAAAGTEFRMRRAANNAIEAKKLKAAGWSYRQIAVHMKLSERHIWQLVKRTNAHHGYLPPEMPAEPLTAGEALERDPTLAPCLQDTPEGFKAFFERFSPYVPGAIIDRKPCEGLAPHNYRIIQSWFEYEEDGDAGSDVRRGGSEDAGEVGLLLEDAGRSSNGDVEVHSTAGRWRSEVIVNAPPRHAKSQVIIWFAIWRIVLDRTVRIILVSKSHVVAGQASRYIMGVLEGDQGLLQAFGPFKDEDAQWSPSDGVAYVLGRAPEKKEATLRSRGTGMQIQGLGCDWYLGDDIVVMENSYTGDQRDKLESWWAQNGISRIDPGGHIMLTGTRVHNDDLFGRLLAQTFLDEDEDDATEESIWTHVTFPALADPTTGQPSTGPDAVELWPGRISRRMLLRLRAMMPASDFAATYQQQPAGGGERLAIPEMFYGDTTYPGCLDEGRGIGEAAWPRDAQTFRVISVDPAATGTAAAILADVRAQGAGLESSEGLPVWCAVLDIHRSKMTGPQMRELFERWSLENGPIDYLIVERNASIYFLRDDPELGNLVKRLGMRLIQHFTGRNLGMKADVELGFGRLTPEFEFGRVRFPGAQDVGSRLKVRRFVDEACSYTSPRDTRDQLMALWFILQQRPNLRRFIAENDGPMTGFRVPGRLLNKRWNG